jgi:hypothetical protein
MLQKIRRIVGLLLLATALGLLWPSMSGFFAVDACLDRGGSYNYSIDACDYEVSHPYAPVSRTPYLWAALVAAAAGFGLILWPPRS